jgi:hypothetical protein
MHLGSVELAKKSYHDGKGGRNSVAFVSDVSPSRFTINNSIDIQKATEAQMQTLSTIRRTHVDIKKGRSRDNQMYAQTDRLRNIELENSRE